MTFQSESVFKPASSKLVWFLLVWFYFLFWTLSKKKQTKKKLLDRSLKKEKTNFKMSWKLEVQPDGLGLSGDRLMINPPWPPQKSCWRGAGGEQRHSQARGGKYANIQRAQRTVCTLYPKDISECKRGLFQVLQKVCMCVSYKPEFGLCESTLSHYYSRSLWSFWLLHCHLLFKVYWKAVSKAVISVKLLCYEEGSA